MAAERGTCCCSLPEEIWLHIVTYLDAVKDVLSLACTCKRLSELTNENIIWRRRFKVDNSQLLSLPSMSYVVKSNSDTRENLDEESGIWKKLYFKASHALSFEHRHCPRVLSGLAGERLCAEFRVVPNSSAARANNIRFDDRAPVKQSVEIWVKLNGKKPDGIIVGCQSESASSYRWPKFHWQILHVGPDGCIRGSLEPYKFMKGPCINDGKWHHIALSASSDWQCMFVDGHVVCSINFGIGHELHRHHMRYSQLGNGVISYGSCTPWGGDAMPPGYCGWYPFHGLVREVRIWSGVLTESDVRRNMYLQRIDLVQRALTKRNKCTLIGYWPMNRLVSGTWPWQGSLVTCTSHLEAHREKTVQLRIIFSTLP